LCRPAYFKVMIHCKHMNVFTHSFYATIQVYGFDEVRICLLILLYLYYGICNVHVYVRSHVSCVVRSEIVCSLCYIFHALGLWYLPADVSNNLLWFVYRRTDRRTHGRTDRRTWWNQYTPYNFVSGGINIKCIASLCFQWNFI
jgi:hypothetical protein